MVVLGLVCKYSTLRVRIHCIAVWYIATKSETTEGLKIQWASGYRIWQKFDEENLMAQVSVQNLDLLLDLKVNKSQKQFLLKLHCPKNERNIRQNSALESKKWSNQEDKGVLLC